MKRGTAYLQFYSLQPLQGDSVRRREKLVAEWLRLNPKYYPEEDENILRKLIQHVTLWYTAQQE